MPHFHRLELSAFTLFVAFLAYSLVFLVPPSAWRHFTSPEALASIGAGIFAVELLVLRLLPKRYLKIERVLYALFLASMPFVYVAAAYLSGSGHDLALECLGIPIFVGLAIYGYNRSCLVLTLGIVAHGIGWDLWHHFRGAYIADWYTTVCLLADITFGCFVLTQVEVQKVSLESREK